MTQVIGCGGNNLTEPKKNLTDKQVVDKFDGFIQMFPSKDLSVLYDKAGGSGLKPGDKGSWNISSYLYTEKSTKGVGVSINFDRNTRKAKGEFILRDNDNEFEYPISYENAKILLVDEENTPDNVKEELAGFKMLYEFIELDREYLENNLQLIDTMYNPNAPIFTADYKFKMGDKNIAKIKEIYPKLVIDEENCDLELRGRGEPWNMLGRLGLTIDLDKEENAYLASYMSFGEGSVLEEEESNE
ncbi:MAG: Csa1 family protein [Sarcina sp.]